MSTAKATVGKMGRTSGFDGAAYQARLEALAAEGRHLHGEADLASSFEPSTVLDAGCGTGRVAIELARRGMQVVGVDRDPSMLAQARSLAPELTWIEADLCSFSLGRTFDLVVLAGNVPLFCEPARRDALVRHCARHIRASGWMIAGFELNGGYQLSDYDESCAEAGLTLASRFSTWDKELFSLGDYAVSVHRAGG